MGDNIASNVSFVVFDEEPAGIDDVSEVRMGLKQAGAFGCFVILDSRDRMDCAFIPFLTNNRHKTRLHLYNPQMIISQLTIKQVGLISLLILKNHKGVNIKLIVHVQQLHHLLLDTWADVYLMRLQEQVLGSVAVIRHSYFREFNCSISNPLRDVEVVIICRIFPLNLLQKMRIINFMHIH